MQQQQTNPERLIKKHYSAHKNMYMFMDDNTKFNFHLFVSKKKETVNNKKKKKELTNMLFRFHHHKFIHTSKNVHNTLWLS